MQRDVTQQNAGAWSMAGLAIARARVAALLPSSMPPAAVRAFLEAVERLHEAQQAAGEGVGRVKSRRPSKPGNHTVPHAENKSPSVSNQQMGGGISKWPA